MDLGAVVCSWERRPVPRHAGQTRKAPATFIVPPKVPLFRQPLMDFRELPTSLQQYQPEKDNDHGGDAARYGLTWLFPTQVWASFSADDYSRSREEEAYNVPYTAGLWEKNLTPVLHLPSALQYIHGMISSLIRRDSHERGTKRI
jgi:hypothetical protein